jgi:hypothetical protein
MASFKFRDQKTPKTRLFTCPGSPLRTSQTLAFGAMPVATAIVGDAHVAAVVALLDMAAECRGTAGLNCGHDPTLLIGEGGSMVGTIGSSVTAEDVRHFQRRPHEEACSAGRLSTRRRGRHRETQTVEWAGGICDQMGGNLGIAGGGRQAGMTE